ncbi:hypothetical protein A3SI_15241 [Nitritalea halalkaliphila LW7]|uniref:Uncharacterized protein n=1 Tax=Nitritalea halalkaliphila LW7 TaxID=1189621 RepID=I5BYZ3_9BACT|nr:hypothetical protein [Nitritalea halalkaliphila]EIM74795.1 hypothetical protein A3SI_15241 [Nitritalea halalkaliphila LW7]
MKERFDKRLADKMRAELEGLDTGYTPGAWEDFARRKWQGGPLIARKWKYFFAGFAGAAALFLFGFFGLSTWWMPADPQLLSSSGGADSLSLASRSFSVSPIRPEPKDIEELDGRASTPSPEPEGASSVAVISAQREVLAQTLPQAAKQTPENTEGTPKPVATTDGLPTLKDLREVTLATTSTATPNWILPPVEKPSSGAGAVVLPNISATSAPREPEQLSVTLAERLENPSEDRAPRAFHIGLLLSPQAVANQSSPLAFGAGIHGGVQIGKRMQVDVGLSLARQEFQPAGPAVEQRVAMATQPASGDRGFAQPNA